MAYGKKNQIKLDWWRFNVGLLGEAGIGKTSVIDEMCRKSLGENRYLFAECGKEDGADAIADIPYINCPSWSEEYDEINNSVGFHELVEDIIENKETEYPDLKVLVIDTYDQLRSIVEPEVIRRHNRQSEKKITSIKQAFGGYMAGDDMCDDIILDTLWELKKVGVQFVLIGHLKLKEVTIPETGDSYMQVTSDMSTRSFNKIKTKLHFLGVATIDRELVSKKIGNKDGKVVVGETRKITFRDDNYSLDSKSRFAEIVDSIPFDSDAFIKAMTDAIEAEAKKGSTSLKELKKVQNAYDEAKTKKASEYSKAAKENKVDSDRNEELKAAIQEQVVKLEKDKQKEFKAKMTELEITNFKNMAEIPTAKLEELFDWLTNTLT